MPASMRQSPEEIFARLIQLPPDEREKALEQWVDDDALRAELRVLLRVHDIYPEPPSLPEDPAEDDETPWPERIGDMVIEREIGRGGMGRVFLAQDLGLQRPCAVKILKGGPHDSRKCERFHAEAQILAKLRHPHIASVDQLGVDGDRPYIVMEYLAGGTLRERLDAGPLGTQEACTVGLQAAQALAAAHNAGVIHRDLKPSNMMMSSTGEWKLVDFGLAKPFPQANGRPDTSEGLVGSIGYASPEQMAGAPADPRSDAWSFGCILFECLAGSPAFPGRTGADRLTAVQEDDPPWDALPRDVPQPVRALLEQLLVRDTTRRLGNFEVILGVLRTATTPSQTIGRGPTASLGRRLTTWALPLAAAVVITSSLVGHRQLNAIQPTPTEQQVTYSGNARDVELSPDGATLALVSATNELDLLDLQTGVRRTVCRMGRIARLYWSRDAKELFFVGDPAHGGGGLFSYVVDVGSAHYARIGPADFRCSSVSPDGRKLVGHAFQVGALPAIGLFDRDTNIVTLLDIEPVFPQPPFMAWSPVADLILIAGIEKGESETSLWLHSLATGHSFQIHQGPRIAQPAWSPDGRAVLYEDDETLLAIHVDPQSGLPIERPRVVLDRFKGTAFSVAGTSSNLQIAYVDGQNTANLWWAEASSSDWIEHSDWTRLTKGTFRDNECRLDADGDRVVFVRWAFGTRDVYVVDLDTGEETRITRTPTRKTWPSWSPDGQRIAYAEAGDGIRVCDLPTGRIDTVVKEVDASYVYWPREGPIFFQRLGDRHLNYRTIDLTTHEERPLLASITGGTMFQAGILPDATKLAVAGNRGFGDDVRVWLIDRDDGSEHVVYDDWAAPFAWCPKGKWLYLITDDPAYDTADGSAVLRVHSVTGAVERLLTCPGRAAGWSSITMSDDCRRIVCATKDVRLDAFLIKDVKL